MISCDACGGITSGQKFDEWHLCGDCFDVAMHVRDWFLATKDTYAEGRRALIAIIGFAYLRKSEPPVRDTMPCAAPSDDDWSKSAEPLYSQPETEAANDDRA